MASPYIILAATVMPPPESPLSQAALLAVFDRVLDPAWLLPLKQPGPGYEVLQAYAAMWERVSEAAVNSLNVFTLSSQGGQLAQGYVVLTRNSGDLPAETVKAGTMVTTSNGNRVFFTTDDAVFAAGATIATSATTGQQSIPIQAAAQDWQWNVPGQANAANGDALAGDVDTIYLPLVLDANGEIIYDPAIAVTNVVPTTGGRPAILDQLAADQGLSRLSGESDIALSTRLRQLPDTVSPGAIQRIIQRVLGPYGSAWTLQEPLGAGVLPPPPHYSGILAGFMDVDPLPVASSGGKAVVQPTTIGMWYFDQGLGPGLNRDVILDPTQSLGALGPSDESTTTSRAFFRVSISWVSGANPGLGFAFFDAYPTTGSYQNGSVPAGDYNWPSAGFLDEQTYDGEGATTPTSLAAGQLYDALTADGGNVVAGGVGFEIVVG
jgi:hypothetical protein